MARSSEPRSSAHLACARLTRPCSAPRASLRCLQIRARRRQSRLALSQIGFVVADGFLDGGELCAGAVQLALQTLNIRSVRVQRYAQRAQLFATGDQVALQIGEDTLLVGDGIVRGGQLLGA